MTAAEPSPFAVAQPELARIGYPGIIPLIPSSVMHHAGRGKAPGDWVSGTWRGLTNWTRYRDSAPSPFQVGMWTRMPGAGAGMLLGVSAGGGYQVVAVDIDVTDADDVALLQSVLPASPMAKRGAKGLTLMYRADPALKSRSYDRAASDTAPAERLVDLLAAGRQTVVPPTRHVAGMQYVWLRGPVPPSELPVLTEDALEKLEDTLETLGWVRDARAGEEAGERRPRAPIGAFDPSDPWSVAKAQALARLDEWVPALDLPGARRARGGWEAIPHWRPSCSGRPLEDRKRNLSFSHAGIRDWGASGEDAGLTAIDVVQRALDLSASEALTWLQEKLGIEDEDEGVTINLMPTVAEDASDLPDPPRGPDAIGKAGAPESSSVVPPLAAEAGLGVPAEIPAHLLKVPGLVGQITDWITDSARRPNRAFALGAALVVLGTAAGRKIAGPTGSGTHLYVLGLADTGSGKDHALNAIPTLMCAAGLERHVGKGEFMSHQAVYTDLMQEPLTVCPMDEFGSFLRKVNNRNGSGSEKAITGVLRTAWGKSFSTMPSPGWATKASAPIHSPALSLFGAATDRDFFTAIDGADLDNGFLNRFLLIATKARPPSVEPLVSRHTVPEAISDALAAIYNVAGPLTRATMHSGGVTEPIQTVGWSTPHVKKAFLAFENRVIDRATADPMMARASEMAIRLATIRALGMQGINDPVVCMDDLEWAMEFAMWSTERLIADAKEHMAENQTERDRAKIQRLIRGAGRITQRDLVRRTNGFTARQVEEITKLLEVAELIHIEFSPPGANGKRSKIYTWVGDQ